MRVKCPECKTTSSIIFSDPGQPISYCPACGCDLTCSEIDDDDTEDE